MLNSVCRRIYGNKIAVETQGSEQLIETDIVIISIGFHADMDFHHNIDREIPKIFGVLAMRKRCQIFCMM